MKKALPTVAALAKKGFHYQLDAKKEAEGKKAIPADAKPKVGTKGKEKAKSKKEALVSAMMVRHPTTWTKTRRDGPNHLGL